MLWQALLDLPFKKEMGANIKAKSKMQHKPVLIDIREKNLEERCQYHKKECPEHHCHGYGLVYENRPTQGMTGRYVCVGYLLGLYKE